MNLVARIVCAATTEKKKMLGVIDHMWLSLYNRSKACLVTNGSFDYEHVDGSEAPRTESCGSLLRRYGSGRTVVRQLKYLL